MVRPIMRNPLFLAQKSEPATEADKQVVRIVESIAKKERGILDNQRRSFEILFVIS